MRSRVRGCDNHSTNPQFEFMPGDDISHTYDAIAAMQVPAPAGLLSRDSHACSDAQLVADFYVQQTRQSPHQFRSSAELDKMTISNYQPTNLGYGNLVYVY